MIKIYGIKNCDAMKKAFKWLEANKVEFDFIDYKKTGADKDILKSAIKDHGWENVINRRGTTWRKLDDQTKETMDGNKAIELAIENPSIIKRPLLIKSNQSLLGFNEKEYTNLLNA